MDSRRAVRIAGSGKRTERQGRRLHVVGAPVWPRGATEAAQRPLLWSRPRQPPFVCWEPSTNRTAEEPSRGLRCRRYVGRLELDRTLKVLPTFRNPCCGRFQIRLLRIGSCIAYSMGLTQCRLGPVLAGTFQTWRDVRLDSIIRFKADRQRSELCVTPSREVPISTTRLIGIWK